MISRQYPEPRRSIIILIKSLPTDDTDEVEHVAEGEGPQVVEGGAGEGGARHDQEVGHGASDAQDDQYRDDKPGVMIKGWNESS